MTGEKNIAAGGCLCGAVRYEVNGPLRDVVELPLQHVPALAR